MSLTALMFGTRCQDIVCGAGIGSLPLAERKQKVGCTRQEDRGGQGVRGVLAASMFDFLQAAPRTPS